MSKTSDEGLKRCILRESFAKTFREEKETVLKVKISLPARCIENYMCALRAEVLYIKHYTAQLLNNCSIIYFFLNCHTRHKEFILLRIFFFQSIFFFFFVIGKKIDCLWFLNFVCYWQTDLRGLWTDRFFLLVKLKWQTLLDTGTSKER